MAGVGSCLERGWPEYARKGPQALGLVFTGLALIGGADANLITAGLCWT
jgi:hypothetical protein